MPNEAYLRRKRLLAAVVLLLSLAWTMPRAATGEGLARYWEGIIKDTTTLDTTEVTGSPVTIAGLGAKGREVSTWKGSTKITVRVTGMAYEGTQDEASATFTISEHMTYKDIVTTTSKVQCNGSWRTWTHVFGEIWTYDIPQPKESRGVVSVDFSMAGAGQYVISFLIPEAEENATRQKIDQNPTPCGGRGSNPKPETFPGAKIGGYQQMLTGVLIKNAKHQYPAPASIATLTGKNISHVELGGSGKEKGTNVRIATWSLHLQALLAPLVPSKRR